MSCEDLDLRKQTPSVMIIIWLWGLNAVSEAIRSLLRRCNTGLRVGDVFGEDGGVGEILPFALRLGKLSLFFSVSQRTISFCFCKSRAASFEFSRWSSFSFAITLLTRRSFLLPTFFAIRFFRSNQLTKNPLTTNNCSSEKGILFDVRLPVNRWRRIHNFR